MEYLYKITVEIDDDMVQRLGQHDLDAVYETVRQAFSGCGFQERTEAGRQMVFTIGEDKDSFSNVGIVANALYDSWLGRYLKKMEWYDAGDDSVEDILKEIREFDENYGKWKTPGQCHLAASARVILCDRAYSYSTETSSILKFSSFPAIS